MRPLGPSLLHCDRIVCRELLERLGRAIRGLVLGLALARLRQQAGRRFFAEGSSFEVGKVAPSAASASSQT